MKLVPRIIPHRMSFHILPCTSVKISAQNRTPRRRIGTVHRELVGNIHFSVWSLYEMACGRLYSPKLDATIIHSICSSTTLPSSQQTMASNSPSFECGWAFASFVTNRMSRAWHCMASEAESPCEVEHHARALGHHASGLTALSPPCCEEAQCSPGRRATRRGPETVQRESALARLRLLQSLLHRSSFNDHLVTTTRETPGQNQPATHSQIPDPLKPWPIIKWLLFSATKFGDDVLYSSR